MAGLGAWATADLPMLDEEGQPVEGDSIRIWYRQEGRAVEVRTEPPTYDVLLRVAVAGGAPGGNLVWPPLPEFLSREVGALLEGRELNGYWVTEVSLVAVPS
jgi:hypothetical protein